MIDKDDFFLSSNAASPESAETLFQRGRQCQLEKRYEEALQYFRRALEIHPDNSIVLGQLATTWLLNGNPREAIAPFQKALKRVPGHPDLLNGLASCYKAQGEFDMAAGCLQQALEAQPDHAESMYNLVLVQDQALDSPLVRNMERLYQSPGCTAGKRALLCFALAKTYEHHGEHARAFRYYEEGNRLYFLLASYDEAQRFALFDELQQCFTPRLFERLRDMGSPDTTPIFVLGMARSGTTLVEQILASHPQVYGAGETDIMPRIAEWSVPHLTGRPYPRGVDTLDARELLALADQFLRKLRSYCPDDRPRISVKTLNNFFHIGLIRLIFPKAAIVHCVRDPMDNCWSLLRQFFVGAHPYCYDQATLGRYYCRYRQLMRHWHQCLPGEIHDVHYEQLVRQPEETIRALLRHCRLSWDDACLDFHRTQRDVTTASMRQVRRPLYATSIQAWKPVEKELAPLREALKPCYGP